MRVWSVFEKWVSPYPESARSPLPRAFLPSWVCSQGVRRYVLAMTLLTATIGAFEALLFSMLGQIVDWLSQVKPTDLWHTEKPPAPAVRDLAAQPVGGDVPDHAEAPDPGGQFPHALALELPPLDAGPKPELLSRRVRRRIAAKVMQTALAVRDTILIVADILVFVVIYFVTMGAVVGGFDLWLLLPFLGWLACYMVALFFFIPRLSKWAKAQADARALMTGSHHRRLHQHRHGQLFSHGRREAQFARSAMQDFMVTVHGQMRLVSGLRGGQPHPEHAAHSQHQWRGPVAVDPGPVGHWCRGRGHRHGLRLNGISHWMMWEMAMLFEHVGTVQDGINTLSRRQTVVDRPQAPTCKVQRGEVEFRDVSFLRRGKRRSSST